jgi:hypothetical protein
VTVVLLLVAACAVAAFVLGPLAGTEPAPPQTSDRDRLERARAAAYRALRELEMDRETGKLGDADYAVLRARYQADAVAALHGLDALAPRDAPQVAGGSR